MEYDRNRGGWQQPEITKFEKLTLHPAAKVLHYATTVNFVILLIRPLKKFECTTCVYTDFHFKKY